MLPFFYGMAVAVIALLLRPRFQKLTLEFWGVKLTGDNSADNARKLNDAAPFPNGASLEFKCGRVQIGVNVADAGGS